MWQQLACFNMDLLKGKLILDSGATISMSSVILLEDCQSFYEYHGGHIAITQASPINFSFANCSTAPSAIIASLFYPPLARYFHLRAVNEPGPMLAGMDIHIDLGLICDYPEQRAWSKVLLKYLPLEQLPTGHLAIDLKSKAVALGLQWDNPANWKGNIYVPPTTENLQREYNKLRNTRVQDLEPNVAPVASLHQSHDSLAPPSADASRDSGSGLSTTKENQSWQESSTRPEGVVELAVQGSSGIRSSSQPHSGSTCRGILRSHHSAIDKAHHNEQ